MAPRIVDVRPVYEGWAKISIATAELENGRRFERLMEDHGPGICVLPYDPTRKVAMLVRQFRAPVCATTGRTELVEAPAGLTDGEEPETAALRELFEETGLRVPMVDLVATLWTMPGISTERMDLFLARYGESDRVGCGGGHASEFENITIVEIALPQLAAMAEAGEIEDMKSFALVQTLRLRQPGLF
jgi:nudix-type nucleoside diphosphatase (YffH/AdpP family)